MCGLAAIIATDGQRDVSQIIERLTKALAHRGPDGAGFHFFRSRSAALGHRRLSIVDLECGAQPMSNEDGTLWVILNGEIFNHLELRGELEALGHKFRTRVDTEVLVHGWESWGSHLVERLNGMYAFLILDQRGENRPGDLWLARDPVGVKPLYLGVSDGLWWASSELRAARQCGLLSDSLRAQAFDEYLIYRFVPSPGTFFPTAWSVPPGHLCRLQLDDLPSTPVFSRFESRFYPTALPRSPGEWREA